MARHTERNHIVHRCQQPTRCSECEVRRRALFRGVPEDQLNWMQEYRHAQFDTPARYELFREGETAEYLYTLHAGWAIIYKTVSNGKRQIMRFALSGDFLGFQADLAARMGYGVTTLTPCRLCAFPRSRMNEMLEANARVAMRLAEMNARYMAICQTHLLCTGRKPAKERLAFLFLELHQRLRQLHGGDDNEGVEFPLAQEEIGDAIGLTNVHVSRTLQELKQDGLVRMAGKRLYILDQQRMQQLAEFDPSVVAESGYI